MKVIVKLRITNYEITEQEVIIKIKETEVKRTYLVFEQEITYKGKKYKIITRYLVKDSIQKSKR